MIMNRIGDIGIIIGIYVIYDMFQTLQFNAIFNIINTGYQKNYEIWENMISGYEIIALLLLFGAIGKSAQIGLHT
jgi:NADH-quinone oxidoreductase subunit L